MAKARTELVHCDNCGEDYAATYRRCPFCNAKAGQRQDSYDDQGYDDYDDAPRQGGGKRLAGSSRSGLGDPARIAIYALAALVVIAVVCILLSVVIPKLVSPVPTASDAPSETASAPVDNTPAITAQPTPNAGDPSDPFSQPLPVMDGMGGDPLDLDSPDLPPVEPDPVSAASQAPASQAPTSQAPASQAPAGNLKLSSTDFTLSPRYPTYQLECGVGRSLVTYSVKNEAVATISSTGLVTAVGDGRTTITVTDQSGNTATATVRVSGISGQSSQTSAPASQAPSGNSSSSASSDARLTYAGSTISEFSITAQHPDPITLKVRGGTASSWQSKNTGVAAVSSNGTVSGVGNGNTTIECTLTDGTVLRCTVHVSGL